MLNIHPSLLPAFPGLDPHGQALQAGVKISGATVHFVTADTDAGPIVMQGAVVVKDDDTAETLSERILAVEHRIYPAAVRLVADMRVRIDGTRCLTEGAAASDAIMIAPVADQKSADDFVAGEELRDLDRGGLRRVRAVHGVLADRFRNLADGALGGVAGSVAPITSRYFAMAFSPSSTCTTTGAEIMNSTSSPKNGRSLCTA